MIVIIHPAVWAEPGPAQRTAYVSVDSALFDPLVFTDFEEVNRFLAGHAAVLDEPADPGQVGRAAFPEYAGTLQCDGLGCYRAASRTLVWATELDLMITGTCARCEPGLRTVATDGGRRVHTISSPVCTRRSAHPRSDPAAMAEYARALVHVKIPPGASPQPSCARCRHALAPASAPPAEGGETAGRITWLDAAGLAECRGNPHSPRPSDIVSVLEESGKEPSAA